MKKYLVEIVLLGLMIALGLAIWFENSQKSLGAGGAFSNATGNLTATANPYMNHSTASSTQTNLVYVGSATTSYAFATDSSDQVSFNFFGAAATTTSILNFGNSGVPTSNTPLNLIYCYQFSDDQVNWFQITSNCDLWTPGTIASSTMNVAVTNVNSKYMKIEFSSGNATSTRFGLWAQYILKRGY